MLLLGIQTMLHYVIMEIKLMVFVQQQILNTQGQSITLVYVDGTKDGRIQWIQLQMLQEHLLL
jgi:hypothetical protein